MRVLVAVIVSLLCVSSTPAPTVELGASFARISAARFAMGLCTLDIAEPRDDDIFTYDHVGGASPDELLAVARRNGVTLPGWWRCEYEIERALCGHGNGRGDVTGGTVCTLDELQVRFGAAIAFLRARAYRNHGEERFRITDLDLYGEPLALLGPGYRPGFGPELDAVSRALGLASSWFDSPRLRCEARYHEDEAPPLEPPDELPPE